MTDVRVAGTPALRSKPIEANLTPHAKTLLAATKDGYDTYGVTAPDGDRLVLVKSGKKLATTDVVTVGDRVAKVNFVENEANTFGERFVAPFTSKGGKIALASGAGLAMAIATPFGIAFGVTPIGWVVGLALWATVGAAVTAGAMAIGSGVNAAVKNGQAPNETVTDAIAKK